MTELVIYNDSIERENEERNRKMKKHNRYYAEYCPYGVHSMSEGDTLMIFETREERDEMVKRLNTFEVIEPVAQAITRKDAASLYRLQDLNNADNMREVKGLRTCADRVFFEIGNKRGGALW